MTITLHRPQASSTSLTPAASIAPNHFDASPWRDFLTYYQSNLDDRHYRASLARLDHEPPSRSLDALQRRQLLRSLAVFQLGESGEGRIAHEIDGVRYRGMDDTYRRCLKYFVAEEGRHGAVLGRLIRRMHGPLLSRNWTAVLFTAARRLMGVRFKLLVLFAAEVVSMVPYAMLARRAGRGPVRTILRAIAREERAHLKFHAAFFKKNARGRAARMMTAAVFAAVCVAACGVVLIDHRRTFAVLRIPLRRVTGLYAVTIRRALRLLLAAEGGLSSLRPAVTFRRPAA